MKNPRTTLLGPFSIALFCVCSTQAPAQAQGSVQRFADKRLAATAASPDLEWFVGLTQTPGDSIISSMRYSDETGITFIPSWNVAYVDVSADGSAVMTNFRDDLGKSSAGIWTAEGKRELGDLGGWFASYRSIPRAMSDDARFVAGYSWLDTTQVSQRAFLWSAGTGMQALETPVDTITSALQVSNDGKVVVGNVTPAGPFLPGFQQPARWVDGVLQPLGFEGRAEGASRNGRVIVGSTPTGPFRWSESEGLQMLEPLPPRSSLREVVRAGQVSDDGRTFVGLQSVQLTPVQQVLYFRWVVWREGTGFVEVSDLLDSLGAHDLASRFFNVATTLSADGNTIVGFSQSLDLNDRVWWKAPLPPLD